MQAYRSRSCDARCVDRLIVGAIVGWHIERRRGRASSARSVSLSVPCRTERKPASITFRSIAYSDNPRRSAMPDSDRACEGLRRMVRLMWFAITTARARSKRAPEMAELRGSERFVSGSALSARSRNRRNPRCTRVWGVYGNYGSDTKYRGPFLLQSFSGQSAWASCSMLAVGGVADRIRSRATSSSK